MCQYFLVGRLESFANSVTFIFQVKIRNHPSKRLESHRHGAKLGDPTSSLTLDGPRCVEF